MIFDAKSVVTVQGFGEKRIVPMIRMIRGIAEIRLEDKHSLQNDFA